MPGNDIITIDTDPANDIKLDAEVTPISEKLIGGEKPGQIRMIGPAGSVTFADPEEVEGFQNLGYEVEGTAEMISRAKQEGQQEEFGGVGGQIQAGARGLLRGASFGASDYAFAALDEALGVEGLGQALLEANPGVSTASELTGAVAPALLSGGTGAVGTIARLTPRGALEALAIRSIQKGATQGSRIARGAGWGAVEGGLDAAGSYVSKLALDEDKQFSGAELGRQILKGSILGAPFGAFGGALTPADELTKLAALRKALPDEDVAKLRQVLRLDDAGATTIATSARRTATSEGRKISSKTDLLELDDIASPALVEKSRASYGKLQERIRTSSARKASDDVDDILGNPVLKASLAEDEYADLSSKLRKLADDSDSATVSAKSWADQHAAAIGATKNSKEFAAGLKNVPDAIEDATGPILARFDEATVAFEDQVTQIRSILNSLNDLPPEAKAAAAQSMGIAGRIRASISGVADSIKSNPLAAKAIDAGQQVAGAMEIAQSLGAPVPSISSVLGRDNILGQAVGLYLQARAGGRVLLNRLGSAEKAANKLGFTRTPLTDAAATVNRAKERMVRTLDEAVATATGAIRRAAAPLAVTGASAAMRQFNAQAVKDQVAQDTMDLPMDIAQGAMTQAEKIASYLDRTKPQNPNQGTPWDNKWKPDPVADAEYGRRVSAALDPLEAVLRVFSTPSNTLEVEAIKECHPDIFAQVVRKLVLVSADDDLREKIPEPMRQSLGRAFGVPMAINQLPGYGRAQPAQQPMQPRPDFGAPSATSMNPWVKGEEAVGPRDRRS